jgi:hypothetical protein
LAETKGKSFLQRMERLDRRWLFLFIALAVTLPLFVDLGMAPSPTPSVMDFYQQIDTLPERSLVLCSFDYDPGGKAELNPMALAVLRHLMDKNLRTVIITLWSTAPGLVETITNAVCRDEYHKQYGVDYCYLGFKEGREAVMVRMGRSIRETFPLDHYRTPITQLPIMNEVQNYSSFRLLVNVSVGYPGTKEYVQYVQSRFAIPLISGASAVSVPEYSAYYTSGQLRGLLTGITGAAEYENLIKHKGLAMIAMGGQTMGHVLIVFFILVGNLMYFVNRRRRAR